jgi:glycosyltransferase involved in cell wall biosynthesis
MKKKVLLLTYYFPPSNYVAINRPYSFAKCFAQEGFSVTVVTRQWTGSESSWVEFTESDLRERVVEEVHPGVVVHRLPFVAWSHCKGRILSQIQTFLLNLRGFFNFELDLYQYREYLRKLLSDTPYDYLLVSVPPLVGLKLAHELATEFKLKLVVDFRDFENDVTLYSGFASSKRRLQHAILLPHVRRWLKNAHYVCTVSPPLTDYLQTLSRRDVVTITNGFDDELLEYNETPMENHFQVAYIGTIYPYEKLDILLEGFSIFFSRRENLNLQLWLVGVDFFPEIKEKFLTAIPASNLKVTERLSRVAAYKIAAQSHVCLVTGDPNSKGVFTTKLFEYMGLRKPILQVPGDRDIVEHLICNLGLGWAPHTPVQLADILQACYDEWELSGSVTFRGDLNEIKCFSRRSQFEILLKGLRALSNA